MLPMPDVHAQNNDHSYVVPDIGQYKSSSEQGPVPFPWRKPRGPLFYR